MDEIRIRTSKWTPILAKIFMRLLKKKLGFGSNIQINSLSLFELDGKIHVHLDLDGEVDEDSVISKILTKIA